MGVQVTDCSQHEPVPCSCPSFRLIPVEFHAEFSSSTLERFKQKLQEVSDRIENAGYTGSDGGAEVVSQLMDEIRAAIADCQVSDEAQTRSGI